MKLWPYKSEGEMKLAGFLFAGESACIFYGKGCQAAQTLNFFKPGEGAVILNPDFTLHADTCPVINRHGKREDREAAARDHRRRSERALDPQKLMARTLGEREE